MDNNESLNELITEELKSQFNYDTDSIVEFLNAFAKDEKKALNSLPEEERQRINEIRGSF